MVLAYTKKYRFLAKNLILGCSLRQKKENEKGKNKQCYLGQYRTIPALRLKHRSGGCGTASALPKYSIIHKVLFALLAWHLPHLARRIGT